MDRLSLFPGEDLIGHYRRVFSSEVGLEVLTHMLFDLGVFLETGGERDIALRNYGNRLLDILAGGEVDKNSMEEFAKKLMRQPLKKGKKDE